jgi:hypothetical protein
MLHFGSRPGRYIVGFGGPVRQSLGTAIYFHICIGSKCSAGIQIFKGCQQSLQTPSFRSHCIDANSGRLTVFSKLSRINKPRGFKHENWRQEAQDLTFYFISGTPVKERQNMGTSIKIRIVDGYT